MPFGFFGIESEVFKEDGEKGENISTKDAADYSIIPILIIGQTQQVILDYLCGLKQNMDEVLMNSELSYYTKDRHTILEIVRTKKELEKFFWEDMDAEWPKESKEITSINPEYYAFSISPAGRQQDSVDLKFCCVTPESDYVSLAEEAAMVWILAKAIEGKEAENLYEKAVRQTLFSLGKYPEKTVMLLLSQFEHLECFYGDGASSIISSKLRDRLYKNCRHAYAECLKSEKHNIMMCQIQLYGGLRYIYSRENGEPVFGVGKDNYCSGYVPVGCHVPLFYLLIDGLGKENTFFATLTGKYIYQELQKSFSPYFGAKQWKPCDMAKEELT